MIKHDHTFVIIPEGTGEPRRIHVSKKVLNIILYSVLVLLSAGFVRLVFYANELIQLRRVAGPIQQENRELHNRTRSLITERDAIQYSKDSLLNEIETERVAHARRLSEVTDELERLENFVTDLKILAGYKLPKQDAQKLRATEIDQGEDGGGEGGVEIDPDAYLEGLLEEPQDSLKGTIDNEALVLAKQLRNKRNDLKDLRNFLEKKATLLEGRPVGWPTSGIVTSEFGPRGRGFHAGIDIANVIGTPIYATGDGVVTFKGYVGAMGKEVEINHGTEFTTVYGHMSRYAVEAGDRVERGDVIGYIGNTGRTTGPHLHYEVRVNGVPVNPRPYIEKEGD
jgi:murein DD-endopeptidase MepM/ murein hydrolase activator NlpD